MTAAHSRPQRARDGTPAAPALALDDFVLLRAGASGGAHRADLQRDLAPVFLPQLTGTAFRRAAEGALETLKSSGLLNDIRGKLELTAAGQQAARGLSGGAALTGMPWTDMRDALVVRALGAARPSPALAKAPQRFEALAAAVLQSHFGLPAARLLSANDLRAELAVVALERAFGNKIKTGLGKGSGLPGKAGRVLAGQLFKTPREFSTDGKLVAALAAEVAGAAEPALEPLKIALLKRLVTPAAVAPSASKTASARTLAEPRPARAKTHIADNDIAPLDAGRAPPLPLFSPPNMDEFCGAVFAAARPVSEGWPGNRKAFISLVWKAIRHTRPDWGLSEVAFKTMLAEAHRTGRLELTGADLKDSRDLKDLEDSKILYKNTVWHFVRVED